MQNCTDRSLNPIKSALKSAKRRKKAQNKLTAGQKYGKMLFVKAEETLLSVRQTALRVDQSTRQNFGAILLSVTLWHDLFS